MNPLPPVAERLAALLRTKRLGHPLEWRTVTNSTMDDAKEALARGAPVGMVVGADTQTAGKGRQGRRFVSPPGGLYFTVILEPPPALDESWRVGFAAALAAREALMGAGSPEVLFDWPNDLVIEGKKVGGVLSELVIPAGTGQDDARIVLGIGLNLGPDPRAYDPDHAGPAGCVPGLLIEDKVPFIAAKLLERLENWLPLCHDPDSWRRVVQSVRDVSMACRGGPVRIRLPDGRVIEGKGIGIQEDGALLVRLPDGSTASFRYGERLVL